MGLDLLWFLVPTIFFASAHFMWQDVGSGDMPLYMQVASGTSNNSLDLLLKDPQIIANMNLRIRGK